MAHGEHVWAAHLILTKWPLASFTSIVIWCPPPPLSMQVAMWGFPNTNAYQLWCTDRLHQDYQGVTKHLIDALPELVRF